MTDTVELAPATNGLLDATSAETYAEWFATLADPTRVRLLHTVSTSPTGSVRVGDLAVRLGISQSTCSHHVRRLAEVGFVAVDKVGTASIVTVNPACCTGLPHAADVVMGTLSTPPCCPDDLPDDVTTRAMTDHDLPRVQAIYAEGIATRNATFETEVPSLAAWAASGCPATGGWPRSTPVVGPTGRLDRHLGRLGARVLRGSG